MSSEYFINEEAAICEEKSVIEEMSIEPDFPCEDRDPPVEMKEENLDFEEKPLTPAVAVKVEPGLWTEDASVPPGWQYRVTLAANKVVVRDCEGRKFHGRRAAILHLLASSQEDGTEAVGVLDQGLDREGWNSSPELPPGWKYRLHAHGDILYMTSNYEILASHRAALKAVMAQHDEETVSRLGLWMKNVKQNRANMREKNKLLRSLSLQSNEDSLLEGRWRSAATIPAGWWQNTGGRGQWLLAPDGRRHHGKRAALEFMINNNFPAEKISEMRMLMKFDGWAFHTDLPDNWMYKIDSGNKRLFCSSTGKLLNSKAEALEHLKATGGEGEFQMLSSNFAIAEPPSRLDQSWTCDDTIPAGWLQKKVQFGKDRGHVAQWLRSPDGEKFIGKRAVLEYMIKHNFPANKITAMRDLLKHDGWMSHQDLPQDWFYKIRADKLELCSPAGKKLSKDSAVKLSQGSEETVEQLKSFHVYVDGKLFGRKRSQTKTPMSKISELKKIIPNLDITIKTEESEPNEGEVEPDVLKPEPSSAEGQLSWKKTFKRKREKKMEKTKPVSGSKIKKRKISKKGEALEKFVPDDSWSSDHTVPEGWLQKRVRRGQGQTSQSLLSPGGQNFQARRLALEHMVENNYPEGEIIAMRTLMIHEGWSFHQDLPPCWMYKRKAKCLIFCSPRGKLIRRNSKKVEGSEAEMEMLKSFSVERKRERAKPSNRKGKPGKQKLFKSRNKRSISEETLPRKLQRRSAKQSQGKSEADCARLKKSKLKKIRSETFTYTPDESLPQGWTLASSRSGKKRNIPPYIFDTEGNLFRSKRHALKHLVNTRGREEDIATLRESLKSDGWRDLGDQLPSLWLVRIRDKQMAFITESCDIVRGQINAVAYLQQHSTHLEDDLKKIRSLKIDRSQEDHIRVDVEVLENYQPSEGWISDLTVPPGWAHRTMRLGDARPYQMVKSPAGKTFHGRRVALRDMIAKNFPPHQISEMRALLRWDGWEFHSDLPQDWMFKITSTHTYFCSPGGQQMTRGKAVKFAQRLGAQGEAEMFQRFNSFRRRNSARTSFIKSEPVEISLENSHDEDSVVKSEDTVEDSNEVKSDSVQQDEEEYYDENDMTLYEDCYDEIDMANYDSDDVYALDEMMASS